MNKSKAAFLLNAQSMPAHLYFWTFTFKEVMDVKTARTRWNILLTALKREFPGWQGLRVFEMHDRHGLHVHLVTTRYVRVEVVRFLSNRIGYGRIHVKKARPSMAHYLGKYLSKERPQALKGFRLWAAFGMQAHCKVIDIIVESLRATIWRAAAKAWNWQGNKHFMDRLKIVLDLFRLTIENDWEPGFGFYGISYNHPSVLELLRSRPLSVPF